MASGVLLINVGTPRDFTDQEVRKYLKEFLMDPYVIDLPWWLRYFLVNGLIIPRRYRVSAALYRQIWSDDGSPLLVHSHQLANAIQALLGDAFTVRIAMRYGEPSIKQQLDAMKDLGIDQVIAIPLYPQYSLAATESAIKEIKNHSLSLRVTIKPPFFQNTEFLDAFAQVIKRSLHLFSYDKLLFSFHGLPLRHVLKLHPGCRSNHACCFRLDANNFYCYRAQAVFTAHQLALRLNLPPDKYEIAFQSRMTNRWLTPFTDERFKRLPQEGIKSLAVVCPSFVADCLETLEEISIRGKRVFEAHGGTAFRLVPSLNATPEWARAVCSMVLDSSYQLRT